MRGIISVAIGTAMVFVAVTAAAATKAPGKAPPSCAAITFRPLPPGMAGWRAAGRHVQIAPRQARITCRRQARKSSRLSRHGRWQTPRCHFRQPPRSGSQLCRQEEDAKAGSPRLILHRSTFYVVGRSCRGAGVWHCFMHRMAGLGGFAPLGHFSMGPSEPRRLSMTDARPSSSRAYRRVPSAGQPVHAEQLSEGQPHKWEAVVNKSVYDFVADGFELKSVAYDTSVLGPQSDSPMSITFCRRRRS